MFDVTINVEGPGSNVEFEAEHIRRSFMEIGYDVTVSTNHDTERSQHGTLDEYMQFRKELLAQRKSEGKSYNILLKVYHQPWGG